jgi:hypothetical protein
MSASTESVNSRTTIDVGREKYTRVFLALLAYKVIYLIAIAAALLIHPESIHENMFHSDRVVATPDEHLTFGCHFASWDAEHYLYIAAHGYEAGASRCAYYPLFPLMIRYFSMITGVSQLISGMILANVFSLAGWCLFFIIVCRRLGESTGKLALVLLVTFPGALFFQFVYSESLFFLLLMLLVLGLEKDRFGLTFLAAFLLPLTRAVGIFCIFPLFWHVMTNSLPSLWERLNGQIRWSRGNNGVGELAQARQHMKAVTLRNHFIFAWLLLAPICGCTGYLMLMQKWTGNAFESVEAQKQIGFQSFANIFNVSGFLTTFYSAPNYGDAGSSFCRTSFIDRVFFVLLLYSIPTIWRLEKSWLLWALFLGVVPAMSGMYISYTRFASVVFPLFVALAVYFNRPGRLFRCLRWIVVATLGILQIILTWRFVNYRWAG